LYLSVVLALTILLTPGLLAAQSSDPPATRAAEIQEQRIERSHDTAVPETSAIGRFVEKTEDIVGRLPINVAVLGLGPGAGPQIGSKLEWRSRGDQTRLATWGAVQPHLFYNAGTGVEFPSITSYGLWFAATASHSDSPQLQYYGEGSNSSIHNQTNYRREDTLFDVRIGTQLGRHVYPACRAAELLLNVGPGTNDSLPTTQSVFGPAQAPGIDMQSNFLITECSLELETLDSPGDPHRGTYLAGVYDRFYAQDNDVFSFNRVSALAEHYFPFLNQKRVIALRALTALAFHSSNQVVPFYLQSTLGSDTDLRGYARYRFYDENLLSMNAEYRWEIGTKFDIAIFVDAGNVFHRPGDVSLSDLKTSEGFGFRVKSQQRVFARFDVGFSKEGVQLWFKFGKAL
jgi:Omp85 superfamily domain